MTHLSKAPAIWYKNKRTWRTIFSWFISSATTLPLILGIVNDYYPSETVLWLILQLGSVQAIITRVMANETVNRLLAYIGLGSAPKNVLVP